MPPKIITHGTIEELMQAIGGGDDQPERHSPPETLIAAMRAYLDDYRAPCRFQPGDLVMPRVTSMMSAANGQPFLVLEVFDEPIRMGGRTDKVHNTEFAGKFDMRVLHEMRGTIVPHVVESWMFEPYVALPAPTHEPAHQAN